jgi:hypothetical protein
MKTSEHTTLSGDAEAFAGVAFAAIAADRDIKDIESIYMQAMFSRMHLFEGWTVGRYKVLFEKLRDILEKQGLTALLAMSVQALPEKLYQPVYAVCVDLVLADGTINKEEKDFLFDLQHKLEINTELAMEISEVICIKNQC